MYTFSAGVKQVKNLPPYFSSHTGNVLFSLFSATVVAFLCYLVILLIKIAPRHSAEVLSSVPKHKKAVLCFMEKRCMLNKIHSGISYRDVSQEFNVNESPIYIKCL